MRNLHRDIVTMDYSYEITQCKFIGVFHCNYVSIVSETFNVCALEFVRRHSKSLKRHHSLGHLWLHIRLPLLSIAYFVPLSRYMTLLFLVCVS